jgi:hypothetical protein
MQGGMKPKGPEGRPKRQFFCSWPALAQTTRWQADWHPAIGQTFWQTFWRPLSPPSSPHDKPYAGQEQAGEHIRYGLNVGRDVGRPRAHGNRQERCAAGAAATPTVATAIAGPAVAAAAIGLGSWAGAIAVGVAAVPLVARGGRRRRAGIRGAPHGDGALR